MIVCMSLKDEIKNISGNKRRFLLLRIADIDTAQARNIVGVTTITYNSWLQNKDFVALYRRRDEFCGEYKQEAIQILRRDNQLAAVLLEGKIISKIKEELESGDYNLIRTHMAKEVYTKLIGDLDATPSTSIVTWQQRIGLLVQTPETQITPPPTVKVLEGSFKEIEDGDKSEEVSIPETEHTEGEPVSVSEQAIDEVEKDTEE
jgi:hypothetical protein